MEMLKKVVGDGDAATELGSAQERRFAGCNRV